MANMVDYLAWRGDVPLGTAPWNEIDALLGATLSYLDFHVTHGTQGWTLEEMARMDLLKEGTTASFAGRKAAFEAMAKSERFGASRLHHAIALTDTELEAAKLSGVFTNGATTGDYRNAVNNRYATSARALIDTGIVPSAEQLAAMGWTPEQYWVYRMASQGGQNEY